MSKFHTSKFHLWILSLGLLNADALYAVEGQEEKAKTKKKAAGIFLYTPCPQSPREYCTILGMRKFGNEAGSFANPGGFVDSGESFPDAAVRETMEEMGYVFKFTAEDLGKNFENLSIRNSISHTSQTDHKALGDFKVDYRLFFKEVSPITAQALMEAAKNGKKLHGGGESVAFALVPIKAVYKAVTEKTPIRIDATNQNIFAFDPSHKEFSITPTTDYEIKLFGPFQEMLREHENKKKEENKISWLRWLQGKPMEADLLRKKELTDSLNQKFGKEPSSNQQTDLGIKGGTGEQYTLVKDEETGKDRLIHRNQNTSSPENLPFTASEAHMRLLMATLEKKRKYLDINQLNFQTVLKDFLEEYAMDGIPEKDKGDSLNHRQLNFFDRIDGKMASQIKKVLEEEQKHKKDYVLYHALNHINAFFHDVLSVLRAELSGNPEAVNVGGIWDEGFVKQDIYTLQHLFEYADSKGRNYQYDQYRNVMLSVNPGLFFNNNVDLEYTLRYWLTDFSHTFSGGADALESAFRSLGISKEAIENLKNHYREMSQAGLTPKNGRLLQMFVDPAVIDQVAYVSDGNRPLHQAVPEGKKELFAPSNILYQLRQDPYFFEKEVLGKAQMTEKEKGEPRPNANFIQLRFLPFSDIVSKGYNFTTYVYDLNDPRTPEQKQAYKAQLVAFVKQALVPAFKQGLNEFKFKGQLEAPKALQTFEKENPGAVSYRPKAQVVKSWVETNNTQELINFVKTYPDAFDTALDEHHSFMGSSATTLLDDLFRNKKWDLLVQLLNASEKRTLNTKRIKEFVDNLKETNIDMMKQILDVLKRHDVPKESYDGLLFTLFYNSHQNHSSVYDGNADKRELSLSIVEKMLGDKTITLKDVVGAVLRGNFVHLSVLNWLAETHKYTDWISPAGLKTIFQNIENIMPSEVYYSKKKSPVWHQDLETFLGHCFQGIQAKKIDVSKIFDSYEPGFRNNPTPESLGLLQKFHDDLKAENLAPNLVASLKNYLDSLKKGL
ncbi:MAG: NUDIX domain-containing protein [Alphaproteobacteria bacterium]